MRLMLTGRLPTEDTTESSTVVSAPPPPPEERPGAGGRATGGAMTAPAPCPPAAPALALALADAAPSATPEALRGGVRPEVGAEPVLPLRAADVGAAVRTDDLAGALADDLAGALVDGLAAGFRAAGPDAGLGFTGAGAGWPVPQRQLSMRRSRSSSPSFHSASARNSRAYVAGIRRPGMHPKRRSRSISTGWSPCSMAQVMRSQLTTAGGAESRISCAVGIRGAPPWGVGCGERGATLGAPPTVARGAAVAGGLGDGTTRRSPETGGCDVVRAIISRPAKGANGIQVAPNRSA
jgi:hypothetical protein